MQSNETLYNIISLKRCNLIQRYNIWYNNKSIFLLFYALFCSLIFYKPFINRHLRAIQNIGFDTFNNIVLAKDGVNIVFAHSVNKIRKNAFHISFFSNLEI